LDLAVSLNESLSAPLYRQLYEGLREAILSGRLRPGQRLPSTRVLARDLSVSRNTVSLCYAELEAEGYLTGRHGSGTYVSSELPEEAVQRVPVPLPSGVGHRISPRAATSPGARWVRPAGAERRPGARTGLPIDFHPGQGAWEAFPREVWSRLLARRWRGSWREAMDYGDPGGYRPLREQVAAYLARSRAVRCIPEQVVIVNGTQQALDLLARMLLRPGDAVAVEDPGYLAARQVFASYSARLIPMPVDGEGMLVKGLAGSDARLTVVTPSHQFPTGATMSLPRRLSLLRWARSEGGLVIEDDYDSGFRFQGRPLPSLQGLDGASTVAYLGSFSKVLFPSLRVGYAVLPPDLVAAFEAAKDLTDRQTPILEQQVLASFLSEGHFDRHLRRMRQLYGERRRALVEALAARMGDACRVLGSEAGMHLMVELDIRMEEDEAVERAAAAGVAVYPSSPYRLKSNPDIALLLGYAGMPEDRIREGVRRIADAWQADRGEARHTAISHG
jgi:GntR family transcriptional regulator / MocR family aminotransferase